VATFIKASDLPWVVQGFLVAESAIAWRDFVVSHTSDSDVVDVVNELAGPAGVTLLSECVEELRRVADTDAELTFERRDENADGASVSIFAKGKGFIG